MPRKPRAVTTLWALAWNDERLSCVVYRAVQGNGLEMRLQSETKTILTERFDLRPRMLARVDALKRSLKRRGWQEC